MKTYKIDGKTYSESDLDNMTVSQLTNLAYKSSQETAIKVRKASKIIKFNSTVTIIMLLITLTVLIIGVLAKK